MSTTFSDIVSRYAYKEAGEKSVLLDRPHFGSAKSRPTCEICSHSFSDQQELAKHRRESHDRGKETCRLCFCASENFFQRGALRICAKCKAQNMASERYEKVMSKRLDSCPELLPFLVGSDRSLESLGGCSLKRPDKLYMSDAALWIECDEKQHSSYCRLKEDTRISDGFSEIGSASLVVIRWVPLASQMRERLDALVDFVLFLMKGNFPKDPIHIFYMFYTRNVETEHPHTIL